MWSDAVLTGEDIRLLDLLQGEFPLVRRPYLALSKKVKCSESRILDQVRSLKSRGIIRSIRGTFDSGRLGYQSTLVGMAVEPERLDAVASVVSQHPGVTHSYAREHRYNLWFTLTIPLQINLGDVVHTLVGELGVSDVLVLPALRVFKIDGRLQLIDKGQEAWDHGASGVMLGASLVQGNCPTRMTMLSELDKACVVQLQKDLALVSTPFDRMAQSLDLPVAEFLRLAQGLLARGIMRRYGAVVNHRKAGYVANAMGCWVVLPSRIEEVGALMASYPEISHCYQRSTPSGWPYNLFTMIHGKTRERCEKVARDISNRTGIDRYVLLYSTTEYKKESPRYFV